MPNLGECFGNGTATFMIMGALCTRRCPFCDVAHGRPSVLDQNEPIALTRTVSEMGLSYVVITSVDRDDLPDGGAHVFAKTIQAIRRACPETRIEVLIPDFGGDWNALNVVLSAEPQILNHNIESVPRIFRRIRPKGNYWMSLELLNRAKRRGARTKSGIMVGFGETIDEVLSTMDDLRDVDCDILTIGQYLRPSDRHQPLDRYYTPAEFDDLKREGLARGFRHVESGPLVRSSYHAEEQSRDMVASV